MTVKINPVPNDKCMELTKFKEVTDSKFSVHIFMISVCYRKENIVEKGENAGYQHFLFYPQCFTDVLLPVR